MTLTIGDITLVVCIILLTIFSVVITHKKQEDTDLHIYKNSELFGIYTLAKDTIIVIDIHNTVQIQDGKARMLSSDCHDKRCVKQGYCNNMPIICLPNRIELEFKRKSQRRKLIIR